jgi:hypothetical protein
MTLQSRMQLHVLVYKIVSLRIDCGNYEDCTTVRSKLEAETLNRIRRLKELENKSEVEVAQMLCDLYEEKLQSIRTASDSEGSKPHKSQRVMLTV